MLANENFNRNYGIFNLNEIINVLDKENTDVDNHHGKMTNSKQGKEN